MAIEHRESATTGAVPAPGYRVRVLRSEQEVETLRHLWDALGTSYVDADVDFFLTLVRMRANVLRPHVIVLERDGDPAALVVGRIEEVPVSCRIGYRTVYRPILRSLTVAHGGVSGSEDDQTARALLEQLERCLAAGEADMVKLPALRTGSPLHRAATQVPGVFRRQHFMEPFRHTRLVLPDSYEQLLASRDRKSRYNIRRSADLLHRTFGGDLSVEVLRDPADHQRIFRDLEHVASKTYQRGLDAGFADTEEKRELVQIGLERGWFRAWVLSIRGKPVAFWQGNGRDGTFFVSSTGYDPDYRDQGVGTYLLLRMFEDLCADPQIEIVDFGWGDADYKRRFGTDSWEEHDVVVFAPSFRGVRVNAIRTAILGTSKGARRALSALGLTARVKKAWRARLRRTTSRNDHEARQTARSR
jgi:ribosomal protein S18 acetylase RimI-like enzyme